MATILYALQATVLEEYALPITEGRDPIRKLYVAPAFFDWVDNTGQLRDAAFSIGGRTRQEHLVQMFCDFRCAVRPLVGDLNRMTPTKKGVWKAHASGLRAYGWVPAPNELVVVTGALIEECHGENSVNPQRLKDVLDFAKVHGLEGTILKGDRLALFPART